MTVPAVLTDRRRSSVFPPEHPPNPRGKSSLRWARMKRAGEEGWGGGGVRQPRASPQGPDLAQHQLQHLRLPPPPGAPVRVCSGALRTAGSRGEARSAPTAPRAWGCGWSRAALPRRSAARQAGAGCGRRRRGRRRSICRRRRAACLSRRRAACLPPCLRPSLPSPPQQERARRGRAAGAGWGRRRREKGEGRAAPRPMRRRRCLRRAGPRRGLEAGRERLCGRGRGDPLPAALLARQSSEEM